MLRRPILRSLIIQRQFAASPISRIQWPVTPLFLPEEEHETSKRPSGRVLLSKFVRYSLAGIASVTLASTLAYEGAHQWVERVEMAVDQTNEVAEWEWDKQAERWSGGQLGGTDPSLGYRGRHAARAAWMAQYWGHYLDAGETPTAGRQFKTPGAVQQPIVDPGYVLADAYLVMALDLAQTNSVPWLQLSLRHAALLERVGSPEALQLAKVKYLSILDEFPGSDSVERARVAHRLADIHFRLNDGDSATKWAKRAIHLLGGVPLPKEIPGSTTEVPLLVPEGPLAKRTLASLYMFLSTYYATSGQLSKAWAVQHDGSRLTNAILAPLPPQLTFVPTTAPSTLHSLYLHHRATVLSVQQAEVQFALTKDITAPLKRLLTAANSSEAVVLTLCGLQTASSATGASPTMDMHIHPSFTSSQTLRQPAVSLLRDARRTASEAWNLCGLLYEGEDNAKALDCVERALGWAGGSSPEEHSDVASSEWKAIWNNYVRIKAKAGVV